jgi:O-acetyl-ADP-ribose deacetylase (regulator of RNase III)
VPLSEGSLLTEAGSLPATHLIYTVMPSWTKESKVDPKATENSLKSAYLGCFRTFAKTGKRHLAVSPLVLEEGPLSCEHSAPIALAALRLFLDAQEFGQMRRISFVLSGAEDYQTFRKAMFSTFPEADQE